MIPPRFQNIVASAVLSMLLSACAVMTGNHRNLVCGTCHEGRPSRENASLKNAERPFETCLDCHDYRGREAHHPTVPDSGPLGNTASIPPAFKLSGGEMTCLTCHAMHYKGDYMNGAPGLLAGGPYRFKRDICFECHDRDYYKSLESPHRKMLSEQGKLLSGTCLVCHAEMPNPEVDRTADVKFQAAIHFLCLRCHAAMEGEFFQQHFLKERNIDFINPSFQEDTFDEMKRNEAHNKVILPLDPLGRVTCSTCHNPHQPGVMVDEKAAKGAGSVRRLRFRKGCAPCHIKMQY